MLQLTEAEFQRMNRFIHTRFGIDLHQKKLLIEGRLGFLLHERGIDNFTDYLNIVEADASGMEVEALLNRITTNHTFFMREIRHYEFLRDHILPGLVGKQGERDLRIWSAGCSTGEEPYCIAMLLDDFLGFQASQYDCHVLATDISLRALEQASEAVYPVDSLQQLPPAWKNKYFTKEANQTCRVVDAIRDNVIFRTFNLMESAFPFNKGFHVIFCRNVMIYFDQPTKMALINKFYKHLAPGGYLFIGHSESIGRNETPFEYVMPAIYRKGVAR